MKKASLLSLFTLCSFILHAQQDITLPGIVVEQNSKYKTGKVNHLPLTSIRAIPQATDISDAEGRFKLVFSDYRGGKTIKVFATKNGYEVVNQKELDNAAVLGRYEPLKIVMCKAGELAQNQVKYYKIGLEAVEQSYRRKIALLDKAGKERDELVQSLRERHNVMLTENASILFYLEKDKNEALAQVQGFSERFAEVNLDDADSLYRAAYEAYMDKRIEDVYKILDLQILEQNMEKAKTEIARGKDLVAYADSARAYNLRMLDKFAQSGFLAADAATKINALAQARLYYEQALLAAPCNINALYAYAQFLAEYQSDLSAYFENLEQTVRCLEKADKNDNARTLVEALLKQAQAVQVDNPTLDLTPFIERLHRMY